MLVTITLIVLYLLALISIVFWLVTIRMNDTNNTDHLIGSVENEMAPDWLSFIKSNTKFYQDGKLDSMKYGGQIDRVYSIILPSRKSEFERRMKPTNLLNGMWQLQAIPKNGVNFEELIKSGMINKRFFHAYENKARVCCHLSHLACMIHFLESSNLQTCMILEDDPVEMDDKTEEYTKHILEVANTDFPSWNIFYASYNLELKNPSLQIPTKEVWRLKRPYGRHAYIVKRSAAELLIKNTLPMFGPGDVSYVNLIKQEKLFAVGPAKRIFNSDQRPHGSELQNDMKMKDGIPPQFDWKSS